MGNVWERFEGIAKPNEVSEAKAAFTPIEEGVYEFKLEGLKATFHDDGRPKIESKFRLLERNRMVFYNIFLQNLNNPDATKWAILEGVNLVSGLLGQEYNFQGMIKFADDIGKIPTGGIYKAEVFYGKNDNAKKYAKLKIKEVVSLPEVSDEETPF